MFACCLRVPVPWEPFPVHTSASTISGSRHLAMVARAECPPPLAGGKLREALAFAHVLLPFDFAASSIEYVCTRREAGSLWGKYSKVCCTLFFRSES
jgi:hypothetical protein